MKILIQNNQTIKIPEKANEMSIRTWEIENELGAALLHVVVYADVVEFALQLFEAQHLTVLK